MRLHLVIDRRSGEMRVQGRDGKTYSPEQVELARKHATSDPDAAAIVDNVRIPDDAGMNALLDDCPDCRAARARGEEPLVFSLPSSSKWPRQPPGGR